MRKERSKRHYQRKPETSNVCVMPSQWIVPVQCHKGMVWYDNTRALPDCLLARLVLDASSFNCNIRNRSCLSPVVWLSWPPKFATFVLVVFCSSKTPWCISWFLGYLRPGLVLEGMLPGVDEMWSFTAQTTSASNMLFSKQKGSSTPAAQSLCCGRRPWLLGHYY